MITCKGYLILQKIWSEFFGKLLPSVLSPHLFSDFTFLYRRWLDNLNGTVLLTFPLKLVSWCFLCLCQYRNCCFYEIRAQFGLSRSENNISAPSWPTDELNQWVRPPRVRPSFRGRPQWSLMSPELPGKKIISKTDFVKSTFLWCNSLFISLQFFFVVDISVTRLFSAN